MTYAVDGLRYIGRLIQSVFNAMANVKIPWAPGYSVSLYTICITVLLVNVAIMVLNHVLFTSAVSLRDSNRKNMTKNGKPKQAQKQAVKANKGG